MLISTKGRYATRMLLDIAQHQEQGYVSMKSIAARQGISKKYLEQFTAQLAKAGLLDIKRGNQGGYRLLKDPQDITLKEVLGLTEGAMHAVACLEHAPTRCGRSPPARLFRRGRGWIRWWSSIFPPLRCKCCWIKAGRRRRATARKNKRWSLRRETMQEGTQARVWRALCCFMGNYAREAARKPGTCESCSGE